MGKSKGKKKGATKKLKKRKTLPRRDKEKEIPEHQLLRSQVIDTFFANTFEYDNYGRLVVVDLVFQQKIESLMAQGHTVYITVASPVYIIDNGQDVKQPGCG